MDIKQVKKIVRNYLSLLEKENIRITKAIIFGSYAKGTANDESDIDLLLISPLFDFKENEDIDKYTGKLWALTKLSNYKIEPIAVGEKKFLENDTSALIEIAKKEGFEIAA